MHSKKSTSDNPLIQPFDYDCYYIHPEHRQELCEILKKYRRSFSSLKPSKTRMINPVEFGIFSCAFEEIVRFFNDDISIGLAHFMTMHNHLEDYSQRAVGFYLDNTILKVVSCWDYSFQILNQFWGLDFLSSARSREILSDIYQKRWKVVETGDSFTLACSDYSEKQLAEINEKLKQALVVLHADNFKKQVKRSKKIALIPELDRLMELFNSRPCKELRTQWRNHVTHGASMTFGLHISGINSTLPTEGLSFTHPAKRRDDMLCLLQQNMDVLQKGIQLVHDIVWDNIVPNSRQNSGKMFYGVQLDCPNCDFKDCMTQDVFDLLHAKGRVPHFDCPKCRSPLTILQHLEMAERDYNWLLFNVEKFEGHLQNYLKDSSS